MSAAAVHLNPWCSAKTGTIAPAPPPIPITPMRITRSLSPAIAPTMTCASRYLCAVCASDYKPSLVLENSQNLTPCPLSVFGDGQLDAFDRTWGTYEAAYEVAR